MLWELMQVLASSFVGIVHIDEVQNFFKIPSLRQRTSAKSRVSERAPLRVAEDFALKSVLGLLTQYRIPFIFSGTPDGMAALGMRLSTAQRLSKGGRYVLQPISSVSDRFLDTLMKALIRYQWVATPIKDSPDLRKLVLELTAGVPRIIIALWMMAHRKAFDERRDELTAEILKGTMDSFLSPLKPAVEALRTGNPEALSEYEDLLPRRDGVWAALNSGVLP